MPGINIAGKAGVLGINRRNSGYIIIQNPRKLYPLVDDKIKTKQLLEKNDIPTPKMYFSISGNFEFRNLKKIRAYDEFVVKPAEGSGGKGIVVITGREGDNWKKANGEILTFDDIKYHVSNILSGLYSLGGDVDKAFVEYCIKSHDVFSEIAYQGVPDIRVIIYRGVPVMSMLRLPTKESDGKANLHQGAVGAGVDMSAGRTFGGVYHDEFITKHPDTGASIEGVAIPFWDDIMKISIKVFEIFRLGYVGIDFVIDRALGPLILELNARPGLNIQLANRSGLVPRLDAVDSRGPGVENMPGEEKFSIAKRWKING